MTDTTPPVLYSAGTGEMGGPPDPFINNLVEQAPTWDALLVNPDGTRYLFTLWSSIEITENFEGSTGKITLPSTGPALPFITERVSDVYFYRNRRLVYRHRILNTEDQLGREADQVGIQTTSYEGLLHNRILTADYTATKDQHDLAWDQITKMQSRQTLGITRASQAKSGRPARKVTVEHGKTVYDAIDEIASVENGFDWWIDASLSMHFQTPRRVTAHGFEWRYGPQVAEVNRNSHMAEYASAAYVTGASQETTLGEGAAQKKYPPPAPIYIEVTPKPFGRWETAFNFNDIITEASLLGRARSILPVVSTPTPSYTLNLVPTVWDPQVRPGSQFHLRVESPPRLNFRVLVRADEIQLKLGADGSEEVSITAQAQEAETVIAGPEPCNCVEADVPPAPADVFGQIQTPLPFAPPLSGVTFTTSSVSAIDELARSITSISRKADRAGLVTIGDEDPVLTATLPNYVPTWYASDGTVYRAEMWNPLWPGDWMVVLFEPDAIPPPILPLPLPASPPVTLGVVPVADLAALGVTTVNRYTPITDSQALGAYGTYMQFGGTDATRVIPGFNAIFDLVGTGGTLLHHYEATIVAGNETDIPGMSAGLFRQESGVWTGRPSLPSPMGSADRLRFILFVVPEVPDVVNPENEPSRATVDAVDTLHIGTYQLAIRPPTGAPIIVNGFREDLIGENSIGVDLPALPNGASSVVWSLFDRNGVMVGQYFETVTTSAGLPSITVSAALDPLGYAVLTLTGVDPSPSPLIDWGDGTVETADEAIAEQGEIGHVYTSEGTYTVVVTQPGHGLGTTTVVFIAPVASILQWADAQNMKMLLTPWYLATDDPSVNMHVDWGDGSTSDYVNVGSFTEWSHTYATVGTYTVVASAPGYATVTVPPLAVYGPPASITPSTLASGPGGNQTFILSRPVFPYEATDATDVGWYPNSGGSLFWDDVSTFTAGSFSVNVGIPAESGHLTFNVTKIVYASDGTGYFAFDRARTMSFGDVTVT